MKQMIARRNSIANRENISAPPPEVEPLRITRERVAQMLREFPETRDDPRTWALVDLVGQYEQYTDKLEWLSRDIAAEVEKNQALGIPNVFETVMSTSLIHDITMHASKVVALRRLLESTCKRADDTAATVVDELIRVLKR
jgi:hypothetical protein